MKEYYKNNERILAVLLVISIQIWVGTCAACTRQRCCSLSTCTSVYCQQKSSQTWISTQNYDKYQYTKLVMADNQCKPCPYNCKRCSTESTCTQCYDGYYLGSTGACMGCDYKCVKCQVVNSISKCSACDDGAYLDSNTLTCKLCPMGAKTCVDQTTIVQCLPGYLKSSNSLFCTACTTNCTTCPTTTTNCTVCANGYYISAGLCVKCSIANCETCTAISNTVYCTTCSSGYYRSSSTACSSCPLNCRACSSATVCTTCKTNYYIQGGGCARVNTTIDSCDVYSNTTSNGTNKCTTCMTGYYLSASGVQCIPCSITCSACYGDHFGRCTACTSTAKLFNQMCVPLPFISSNKVQLYFTPAADASSSGMLSGGSALCSSLLYSGTSITLQLNSLSAYKLVIQYRLFTGLASQAYSISLNSSTNSTSPLTANSSYNTSAQVSSSLGYQICASYNSSTLYYSHISSTTFTSVKLNNTLSFTSSSALYIAEVLVTAFKCSPLCIECSQSQCYTCMTANLYTQDAYCVYTCTNGYYTYQVNKQCVKECPLATYPLLTNVSCMACVSPCMTCLNDKYCLSCIQGYFLSTINNTCEKACPYRYFGSIKTQKCEQCVGRCNECIDDEKCTTCQVGFLDNTTCVDTCQNGSYSNLTTLKCQLCQSTCLTCSFQQDYCLTCPSGKLFYNYTCISTCPDTYYADTSTSSCLSCAYPCQKCQTLASQCVSCIDGYLSNSTCLSSCPSGFYQNNVLLSCQPCSPVCTKCYSSASICLQCVSGYKLHNSACISTCPDGYYPEALSNYNMTICSKCTGLCQNCLNLTYCLSCNSNFLADNGSGLCVRSSLCSMSYYANIASLKCEPCDTSCLTCYYTPTTCTSCNINAVLYNNTCLSSCPSQYFYNTSSIANTSIKVCSLCEQPCLTCLNQTQCLSCVAGYKYSSVSHVCSSTCSIGSFFNKTINDCQPCSTDCLTCDTPTFCYACKSGTYLYIVSSTQNKCMSACPDKYYADGLSCMACLYPCDKCSSSIDCLSCQNGVLYQSRCLSGCPQSTYMDTANNICLNCSGNCLTCKQQPTKCTLCISGYYLVQSQYTCVSTCPDGTYPFLITKQCASCPQSCSKCTNSSYCTACVSGKTYLNVNNHTCTQFCATGYYSNTSTGNCELCAAKCYTCAVSASQCLTCSTGYLLVRLANATYDCVTVCPPSYYNDSNACYHCIFPCQNCTSASQCTTCAPGTYLHVYSHSCLMSCPLGTYYSSNSSTPSCINCVSPCQTCTNSSTCVSCVAGYLLLEGTCVTSCPAKYYADASGICNRCYGLCQTCSGKYQCLTCQTGFSYSGYCYSACPPGTYASQKTRKCQPCESPCLECAVNATYCKRCQYNMFAYRGQCSPTCPIGTYQATEVCVSCQFPCVKCSNQFTCEQCIGGYLLYMRTSCIENVQRCPNDLYKMDSKQCVPSTWCPVNYYRDEDLKTCSKQCSRQKYVNVKNKTCLDSCAQGEYVGQNMVCKKWAQQPPTSLMGMNSISFIKSSQVHIVITFNQSISWLESNEQLYTIKNLQVGRRLLSSSSISTISYNQESEQELILQIKSMPYSAVLTLPAHLVASSVSGYNLQTPTIEVKLPKFTAYSYEQAYTASIMKQFSEGISWFIILFSMFFVFMNRLSDSYILWDTAQLLYLLIFLNIQYPSNLNDFLVGLSNIHFLFVPSIFSKAVPSNRFVSSSPFYAYSYDNSFLRTAGSPILLIAIAVAIYLILKLLEVLSTKVDKIKQKMEEYPTAKNYIFKGLLRYRWHHTSDIIFLSYDIIVLFAVAEIANISQNPNNIASNVICVITLIIYLAFPCFVSYKLYKHYKNISKGKMVANLQCFYRGIQKTNKFGISLIVIRYFRKLTYCVIIGVFTKQPMFALPILMFTSVLMGLFIFINKPFKKKLSNIVTVATEIILVFVFMLIALIQFGQDNFNTEAKIILGWVCCGLLVILLFTLVFQIFCKTMFYLQPEKQKQSGHALNQQQINDLTQKFSEQYLRQKAGQFFDKIFPKLKQKFNFDDSQEALNEYEKGDSENSQNNEERQKNWGLMSQSQEKRSDQFRHYGNQEDNQSQAKDKKQQKAPNYLIRCVKQIQ